MLSNHKPQNTQLPAGQPLVPNLAGFAIPTIPAQTAALLASGTGEVEPEPVYASTFIRFGLQAALVPTGQISDSFVLPTFPTEAPTRGVTDDPSVSGTILMPWETTSGSQRRWQPPAATGGVQ
jgi:hypothetical protein